MFNMITDITFNKHINIYYMTYIFNIWSVHYNFFLGKKIQKKLICLLHFYP